MKNKLRFKTGMRIITLIFTVLLVICGLNSFSAKAAEGDTTSNTWTTVAGMNQSRSNFGSVVLNGKIYAIGGGEFLASTEVYDPATNKWTKMASMNEGRKNFTSVALNGKIYAAGGLGSINILPSMEVYDPAANTWTKMPRMNESRSDFASVVLNGKIYVMGGVGNGFLSSAEVYDPATNTWTKLASMNGIRRSFFSFVLNGKIYVVGGNDGQKALSSPEVYDPATNTWTKLASMNEISGSYASVVLNGKIYTMGVNGKGLRSTEVYDPATNTWTTLAGMKEARGGFAVLNGKIYAMGGDVGDGYGKKLTSTEVYDPATNTWTKMASMKVGRDKLNSVVLNGNIYVIGGVGSSYSDINSVEVYTSSDKVFGIELNKTSTSLKIGDTDNLIATTTPEGIGVSWASSDTSVATVDSTGKVTAVKAGTATITATTTDGSNLSANCEVTVTQLASKIELNKTTDSLQVGQEDNLVATITPEDATNKNVTWTSSDSTVATVDENGKVTAIKAGTATITAATTDGSNLSAACEVTVIQLASKIELNKTSDSLQVGQEDNLVATITPEDATNKNVTWTSSDTSVATVDENGKVTAIKAGTATITATTTDGSNLSAACTVIVTDKSTGRAILNITMSNNVIKIYDLSVDELNAFLNWYDARSKGIAQAYYVFENKPSGGSIINKDYIPYDKIEYFNVQEF